MQIFGRRPRQRRGSRCFVLLLPLLLVFAVLLVLTVVRYPSYTAGARVTGICLTCAFGLASALAAALLYKRTRRFYALGRSEEYGFVALTEAPSRYGRDVRIEFFAAKAEDVRAYLAADGAGELFSSDAALTQAQRDELLDAYFALTDALGKSYSYQEFIPFDLQFLYKKEIFLSRQLYNALAPALPKEQLAQNGNKITVYDPVKEWAEIREAWLHKETP